MNSPRTQVEPLLTLRGLRVEGPGALPLVEDIDFVIRAGETLCLAHHPPEPQPSVLSRYVCYY